MVDISTARLLAAIVESSDDAILSKDLGPRITSWNRAAERMFGYTASEAIGESITVIFPESRPSEEEGVMQAILRGEKVEHYEADGRRKDGTVIPVSASISPIHDGAGRVVGTSCILRDITERRRIEIEREASARTARRLAAIVESSDDAIISGDLELRITSWNRAAERMFGYT